MKRKWKRYVLLIVLWLSFPILLILAIQETGSLTMEKEDSIEEILPFLVAVSIKDEVEQEHIKAMAVIWRSNLMTLLQNERQSVSDIKKKYLKIQKETYIKKKALYENAVAACGETKGEILTYQGDVCYCPFFYVSSGITRDAFTFFEESAYPYLISVPSHKDENCDTYSSYYYFDMEEIKNKNWNCTEYTEITKQDTVKISEEENSEVHEKENIEISETISKEKDGKRKEVIVDKSIESKENDLKIPESEWKESNLLIIERDLAGYVTWVKVEDAIIGGEVFRKCMGISSSNFTIEQQKEQIRIICKGSGHGFGYSQYGGNQMAREGLGYVSLLKHYFPELRIEKCV